MREKILPLGSVVTLKDGDGTQLMIITRASIVNENGKEIYYDYGAVLIPQGMMTPEHVYFFNKSYFIIGEKESQEIIQTSMI